LLHTDERFSEAVEAAVIDIERGTDAEIVVVAAPRSGSYRDLAFAGATAGTFVGLGLFLFMPWTVHPASVLVELALLWALLAWLLGSPIVLRRFASRRRMESQVELAAHAEFHQEAVHGTPHRTGVLIYVSALEGKVQLVPDAGIEARIPRGAWAKATGAFSHDDLEHFLEGMSTVGKLLATHVPKLEDDQIDLPNAPRIRT
jgi:putative membrane protein